MKVLDTLFNRIFVPSQLTQLLNTGTMNHAVLAAEKYNLKGNSLAQTLTNIYGYLKYNHRNEYFYKNELFNKIVLGRHSLKTTSAIRELPVGKAIADFIIINGKAQVYEIKTDLDNLDRVKAQITSYFKAFKYVNVITCDTKVKSLIRKIDEHVAVRERNHFDGVGSFQIHQERRGGGGIDQDSVNGPIAEGVGGLGKGQVLGLDVIHGQTQGLQDDFVGGEHAAAG